MRHKFSPLLCVAGACLGGLAWPAWANADERPKLADQTSFQVPLTTGQTGTALLLPSGHHQTMVVAAGGSPPVLALYRVTAEDMPQPDPSPDPGPEPDPKPGPKGPLSLIWIEETADRTPEQALAIVDAGIRESLRQADWSLRVADVDVIDEHGNPPADLRPYIEAAQQAGTPRLFAVDSVGAEVFAGKAPADTAAFRAILRQLGLGERQLPKAPVPDSELPQNSDDTPGPVKSTTTCPDGNCPVPRLPQRFRLFR